MPFVWVLFVAATDCRCGSFETAVTNWSVEETDCCKSTPLSSATVVTYVHQGGGVYVLDETTNTTGQEAQDDCCGLS